MFFSAALSAEDIARKVRSIYVIKDAARILREEINSSTFGLENKHCDAFDLQDAWTDGKMTGNAETFLATLLNLNRITVDNEDSNNKEIDLENLMLDSDNESDIRLRPPRAKRSQKTYAHIPFIK